ncbi:hypothetical protein P4Q63_002653, partial [Salmonella enterica]|nr:hypothetical protein [Salmonella enterica]
MKERILVWILVLTCFCGELAIHYMVYQDDGQDEGPVDPVYTLPENATLVGSRAVTALLG